MKIYVILKTEPCTRQIIGTYKNKIDAENDLEQFGEDFCIEQWEIIE